MMKNKRGVYLVLIIVILGVAAGIYLLRNNQSKQHYDAFADTTREVQYSSSSTWDGKTYDLVDGKIYAYIRTSLCALEEKKEIAGADSGSFVYLGEGYAKDKSRVYYLNDGDVCSAGGGKISVLDNAEPASFVIKKYPEVRDTFLLGLDSNSVYFDSELLVGINPQSMRIEQEGNIIRDEDTVWLQKGNCHSADYEPGMISDISSYQPPC